MKTGYAYDVLSFSISCVIGNTTVSHSAVKVSNTSKSRGKKKVIKALWFFGFFSEKHPIFSLITVEINRVR